MSTAEIARRAAVFAALGDLTRLHLLGQMDRQRPRTVAALTLGTRLTRQAVAKHLRVLQRAGVVQPMKVGRELHFALRAEVLAEAYLRQVTLQWDDALQRQRAHVEEGT